MISGQTTFCVRWERRVSCKACEIYSLLSEPRLSTRLLARPRSIIRRRRRRLSALTGGDKRRLSRMSAGRYRKPASACLSCIWLISRRAAIWRLAISVAHTGGHGAYRVARSHWSWSGSDGSRADQQDETICMALAGINHNSVRESGCGRYSSAVGLFIIERLYHAVACLSWHTGSHRKPCFVVSDGSLGEARRKLHRARRVIHKGQLDCFAAISSDIAAAAASADSKREWKWKSKARAGLEPFGGAVCQIHRQVARARGRWRTQSADYRQPRFNYGRAAAGTHLQAIHFSPILTSGQLPLWRSLWPDAIEAN